MPQCVGTSKRTGNRCKRSAYPGATVCEWHGARAPQVRRKADERTARAEAEKVLRRFGEPVTVNPAEALLDTVHWTAGYVAWLREKVAQTESDEALTWGVVKETDDAVVVGNGPEAFVERITKQTRGAEPSVWLRLLGEWSDRLVAVCAAAIKAGIEERRVRLAEDQGRLVVGMIRDILAELSLTPAQQMLADVAVPRRLRAISGGE